MTETDRLIHSLEALDKEVDEARAAIKELLSRPRLVGIRQMYEAQEILATIMMRVSAELQNDRTKGVWA